MNFSAPKKKSSNFRRSDMAPLLRYLKLSMADWKERLTPLAEAMKHLAAKTGGAVRAAWQKSAPMRDKIAARWSKLEWPKRLAARTGEFSRKRILEPLQERSKNWKWTKDLATKLPGDVKKLEPAAIAAWAGQAFQKQGIAVYGTAATIVASTYFLADLTALVAERFIPEPPPARVAKIGGPERKMKSLDDYNVIFTRNLFNSKGIIPGEETPGGPVDMGGAPTRTTLPFNLIGTLILRDELKSIATIEDKSMSTVYPVRIDDEIPSKARIVSIESRRVVFVNVSNGRREFVDLPEDPATTNPRITLGTKPAGTPGIEQVSANQFNVQRTEVDKALANINEVLTQARCVPNFENGLPSGYKCFQIVPGSIYDKLGMQNGDVICGLNGSPINDPGKAFEMFSELKTANHLELCIKRDGRQQNYAYDIR